MLTTLPSNVESIYSPETLGLAILVLDKPFWSRPSICDTSSSAESSIYSDRSNKPFLKYIRQDIFQKRVRLEIYRTIYEFPLESIVWRIPIQNTVLNIFGLLHFR